MITILKEVHEAGGILIKAGKYLDKFANRLDLDNKRNVRDSLPLK
jgi:hypothetical protein